MEFKVLTIEDIKNAEDVKIQEIFVPEWDGIITMKGITQQEINEIRKISTSRDNSGNSKIDELNFILTKLCYSIIKPEIGISNITWLKNKSHITLDRLNMYSDFLSSGMEILDPLAFIPKEKTDEKEEINVKNLKENLEDNNVKEV